MSASSEAFLRPQAATEATPVSITRTAVGRRTVLTVAGEIDLDSAPVVADAVDEALEDGAFELWLDLSPIQFMDSSGVHLLLETQMRVRALTRQFAVVCPDGPARRVLELTGASERLPLYADRAAVHRGE
jgi:anti-sigma B factor antagonist